MNNTKFLPHIDFTKLQRENKDTVSLKTFDDLEVNMPNIWIQQRKDYQFADKVKTLMLIYILPYKRGWEENIHHIV